MVALYRKCTIFKDSNNSLPLVYHFHSISIGSTVLLEVCTRKIHRSYELLPQLTNDNNYFFD